MRSVTKINELVELRANGDIQLLAVSCTLFCVISFVNILGLLISHYFSCCYVLNASDDFCCVRYLGGKDAT